MSNKTDDVEQDAAFALAEMHRLRTALQQAERDRDALLAAILGPVGEEWFAIQKALGFPNDGMARGLTDIGDAAVLLRERCERAEADNAAWLMAAQAAVVLLRDDENPRACQCGAEEWTTVPDHDSTCPLKFFAPLLANAHPGAALLERLRALEMVREAVRDVDTYLDFSEPWPPGGDPVDPSGLNAAAQRLVDACRAFNALTEKACDECGMVGTHKLQCWRRA